MPDNKDYRCLLDEKFNSINIQLDLRFNEVHTTLDNILQQTTKTNGKVLALEDKVTDLNLKDATHLINCPQKDRIGKIEDELNNYKEAQSDLNFIQRHPMLGIAGIGVAVVIVIAVFFGWNKISYNSSEKDSKELINKKFEELTDRDNNIQKELNKQTVYYEKILKEINNK